MKTHRSTRARGAKPSLAAALAAPSPVDRLAETVGPLADIAERAVMADEFIGSARRSITRLLVHSERDVEACAYSREHLVATLDSLECIEITVEAMRLRAVKVDHVLTERARAEVTS